MRNQKPGEVQFSFLPKSKEKVPSIIYGCLRIIDSGSFLNVSLDSLVETLIEKEYKKNEEKIWSKLKFFILMELFYHYEYFKKNRIYLKTKNRDGVGKTCVNPNKKNPI